MNRGSILAIDDERNIRRLIKNELGLEGFDVTTAKSGEDGLKVIEKRAFDVMLLDIRLPEMDGMEVLRRVRTRTPRPEVIMITGHGDIQTAVESMKLGARDYITKPFKLSELIALVTQIANENQRANADIRLGFSREERKNGGFVVFTSSVMKEVYDLMERAAPTDVTVLIQGETGVGKDVMARQLHYASLRKDRPFVVVDCGLLNENLAESELYGHTRGAFSGASEPKKGLVEESDSGTLFFDEIGNIELEMQKKFLRFLETKRYRRLGETREREVDSRIVLATNVNLSEAAAKGTMRKDLFYRMDVICVSVPPLREHPEDVEPLARHFLDLSGFKEDRKRVSPEAMTVLRQYGWPGNIRELRSAIVKAAVLSESPVISPEDLPSHVFVRSRRSPVEADPKSLEDLEREHIMRVLADTGGNQSRAAEILGINRKTLYKKIHKHGLLR